MSNRPEVMSLSFIAYAASVFIAALLAHRLSSALAARLAVRINCFPGESWRSENEALNVVAFTLGFTILVCLPLGIWAPVPATLDIVSLKRDIVSLRVVTLVYGGVLGIGELSFAALICLVIDRSRPSRISGDSVSFPSYVDDQFQFATPLTRAKLVPAYLSYAVAEEVALRAVAIQKLIAFGPAIAVAAAVFLSLLHQFATEPERKRLPFIIAGTVVTAVVHSMLFAVQQELTALIAARFVIILRRGP
jgi:hypothetical protein